MNVRIKKRRAAKIDSVNYMGGKCQMCGKNHPPYIYDFHYKNRNGEFRIAELINRGYKIDRLIPYLDECIMLCGNCHMELIEKENSENKSNVDIIKYRTDLRDKYKLKAIQYLGGKCKHCGYDKSKNALVFHHIDPVEKEIQPGKLFQHSWENIKQEIDKCELLCVNCHREFHHIE